MTGQAFTPAHACTGEQKRGCTMKARVLVVDDEKDFAQALAERLQGRGYDATACFSGKEAIAKLMSGPIDVVVLDVMMPEMGGIEALHSIKKAKPLTEVILLSGKATLETAITGMQQGAFEYLTKPCDADTMTRKIDEAHQRKKDHENRIRRAMAEADAAARRDAGK
jgi:DNA-binding NtrC family response regulator